MSLKEKTGEIEVEEEEQLEEEKSKKYVKKHQIIYYLILGLLSFLMMLSNFLPWDTYITMNSLFLMQATGTFIPIIKTFTPLNWVWSDIVPFLSYLPLIGGILLLVGMVFYLLEYAYGKKIMAFGPLSSILIYALYILLFWLIPVITELAGITFAFLEEFRIPNEVGAYLCLLSGIISIPFILLVRLPEIEEPEPEALKIAKVAVPWKKAQPKKGEVFCPHCGAVVKAGTPFCNECGTYF